MSACVSKSFQLTCSSPLKIDEDNNIEKQGIITILGSDCQSSKAAASLRRTLSADMSSKKWQSQNGFNSMKKIASSAQLLSQESNKKGLGHDEIWASIQLEKDKQEKTTSVTAWNTIITQEQEDSTNLPPPYIHPLVKRSTSSLSEKSLEICTESLGTETGSDVFASYPTSEIGDIINQEDEKDDVVKINNIIIQDAPQPQQQLEESESSESGMHVVKYNYSCSKKLPPKSFPPPLPSLAQQDGASLQMQSHRENGRLVLEAVSIPTKNYFHVQREEGRLLLTLVDNSSPTSPHHDVVRIEEERNAIVKEYDQVFDVDMDEVERKDEHVLLDDDDEYEAEEENEEEEKQEFMFEQSKKLPQSRVITMPKAAFMMNKFMGLRNKNLTWSQSLINKAHVKLIEEEEMVVKNELTPLPQSLPPPPRVARLISTATPPAAGSFNAYEYFWREKQSVGNIISPIIHEDYNTTVHLKNNHNKVVLKSNLMSYEQQNLVLMKGGEKGDYLVPFMSSKCNEPRRSLLFWEPYCIATS